MDAMLTGEIVQAPASVVLLGDLRNFRRSEVTLVLPLTSRASGGHTGSAGHEL